MCIPHKEMFFVLFCHCFLPHKCRFSMFRCSGFSPTQPVVSRQGTPQIQKSVGGGGWGTTGWGQVLRCRGVYKANVNPVAIGNFSSVQKPRLFFVVARVLSGPWLVNKSTCKKSSLGNIANLSLSEFKLVPRVNKKPLVSTLAWTNVFPLLLPVEGILTVPRG